MQISDIINRAEYLAINAHAGQFRKYTGDPYVSHCFRVCRILLCESAADHVLAAAMLHDTLEDVFPIHPELVSPDIIQEQFGSEVLKLVQELTDHYTKNWYPDLNRKERKTLEAQRYATISDTAKKIKLADLVDNTSSIVQYDKEFAKVYIKEKEAVIEAIGFHPDWPIYLMAVGSLEIAKRQLS